MFKKLSFVVLLFLLIGVDGCRFSAGEEDVFQDIEKLKVISADKIYTLKTEKNFKRKATYVDSVFNRLQHLTGFNGTVLFAEQERIV